jgi:glycogen operon protein
MGLPTDDVDVAHLDDPLARHAPIQPTPRRRTGVRPTLGPTCGPKRAGQGRIAPVKHIPDVEVWPGASAPLGAHWDGTGTNFALWSAGAQAVDLCLFDDDGVESRHRLQETTHQVWHGRLPGIGPGQSYGFRVHGGYDPGAGLRYNPSKLLLDPYARAVDGELTLNPALFGYPGDAVESGTPDQRDSAPYVPRGVVIHNEFPWGSDRRPGTSWSDTVIYELHVKGATMRHPDIPPALRGTYAGLAHPAFVEHLLALGVTAVELMPVHHFVSEPHLLRRGLTNYWGYNTLGYFAPHAAYSSSGTAGAQVTEFKAMVKTLHAAGIEVILDVVYNHTAEGSETGPTLAFRGIDNPTYYRLRDDPRYYLDYTGTGNTLNAQQPHVLQLIMDSLRYWVTEMHVDGFRFDLAAALARSFHDVDKLSGFFEVIQQDPVLSQVKLIAEPWDLGPGGYQVGEFPPLWTEWNGKYRDTVRDFWRGAEPGVAELGYRLTGSSDLYQDDGRRPYASINFVTCHDGFSLRDLVSYDEKHNEANGQDNRDGSEDNRSWNCGVEGETDDDDIVSLRARQMRNFLATLLLSTGVPMLRMGDEFGHSQLGNNNAYCQDNDISWLSWSPSGPMGDHVELVSRLVELRRTHPVFRQRAFFQGRPIGADGVKDLTWFTPEGVEMSDADWSSHTARTLGMYLSGDGIRTRGPRGERIRDRSFVVLLHAGDDDVDFRLPGPPWAEGYSVVLDTGAPTDSPRDVKAGEDLPMTARSLVLLHVA